MYKFTPKQRLIFNAKGPEQKSNRPIRGAMNSGGRKPYSGRTASRLKKRQFLCRPCQSAVRSMPADDDASTAVTTSIYVGFQNRQRVYKGTTVG